jgi:GntR family transcriptional regulator, transcriptional repressor for pyruvate dehydrogenase complex
MYDYIITVRGFYLSLVDSSTKKYYYSCMDVHEPNSETLANTVAERIHDDIIASELQEGDLFMTGDQVAERYSVSRSIAREALSQLRALGVLKSRQRKGLLVARPDPVKLSARLVPLYCRGVNRRDFKILAQLRYALEVGTVDLAVPNGSPEQVGRLAELAGEFEGVASVFGHSVEADRLDLAFHTVILEMTGNPLIAGMHRVLSDYFHASTVFDPCKDASKAVREHHMIAEAFRRGDREMVRTLLRSHLERTLEE